MVAPGARPKPAPLRGLRAARGRARAERRAAAEPEAEQVLRGTVGLVEPSAGLSAGGGSAGRGACLLSSGTLIIPAANVVGWCADKEYILIVMQNPNTDERIG